MTIISSGTLEASKADEFLLPDDPIAIGFLLSQT